MEAFGGGRDAHFEAPPLNDRGAAVAGQLSASLEHIKTWCVRHCESSAAAGAGAAAALEEKLERLRKQLEVFTDAVETLVGGHAESSSCVVGSPDCAALATTVKYLDARVNASQERIETFINESLASLRESVLKGPSEDECSQSCSMSQV